MYPGRAWTKVFEWWAGQSSLMRYGIALGVLALSFVLWAGSGKISIWGLATGLVLLIAAAIIRD